MSKFMKTYLLTFLAMLASVAVVQAAATKFTDVRITKTLVVDGAVTAGSVNCSNVSTTTLTANDLVATYGVKASTLTVSGATSISTMTVTGAQGLRLFSVIASSLTTTAEAVNILAVDSLHNVYVSTAVTGACWVKVGSQ